MTQKTGHDQVWRKAVRRCALGLYASVAIAVALAGVVLGYLASGAFGGRFDVHGPQWLGVLSWWEILISLVLCLGAYEIYKRTPRRLRWLGIAMSVAASLRYMTWRITYTLNFDTVPNSIACGLLLAAEFYALLMLALGHFQTFWPTNRSTPRMPPGAAWPSVDVFITTYNEEVDLVRKTAVGCAALDYPNKEVYILDDGRRPEMRALAQEVGVRYLDRSDNRHAKAGNLNHALSKTSGQLIAQFDADHVPVRSFLRQTVPFFLWDEKLAFVQTPHHFYNHDAFQRNLLVKERVANEQDLFFHVVQPGNDRWNAAFFCGSNAVLSRVALESIDGFATETITEDAHTALRLHANKWNSAYVDRNLAAGLAAETFGDIFSQRIRWGVGMCSILRIDNPLLMRGLTLAQRLCYSTASVFFLYGIPRQIYFLAPIAFMLVGVSPIDANILKVLTYYLPHWLAAMLLAGAISRNVRHTFWSEVFETALAFPMSVATIWSMVTRKKIPFKVTPKNTKSGGLRFNIAASVPQLVLLLGTVISISFVLYRLQGDYAVGVLAMNLFWCVYNMIILAASVLVTVDRPQLRQEPRVPCLLPVLVIWVVKGRKLEIQASTLDLSEGGAHLVSPVPLPVGVPLQVQVGTGTESTMVDAKVVRVSEQSKKNLFGSTVRFESPSIEQRHQLIRLMYTDPNRWSGDANMEDGWASFGRLALSSFRWVREKERPTLRRAHRVAVDLPAILGVDGKRYITNVADLSQGGVRVVGNADKLRRGTKVELMIKRQNGDTITIQCQVIRQARHNLVLAFSEMTQQQHAELLWDMYVARKPEDQRLAS